MQAKSGGDMSSGGFAARAQAGAAHNTNTGPGGGQNSETQASTGQSGALAKK